MGLRLHSAVERPTRHLELIQLERLAHGTIADLPFRWSRFGDASVMVVSNADDA